ncbi:hypothetical protein Drose_19230 [Dactylosporangium roseum]|uniref:Uncharacterized protein n=1 Tax=Dactylosporangium roseum TaxID=47989 RepID=A0ABY5YUP8_9ACTN|nr:hypothetical protein [Dactylosporangium roseum]UWZ33455.1 hypothetical protein Drose_19230 [Dactylosporangium roseum]
MSTATGSFSEQPIPMVRTRAGGDRVCGPAGVTQADGEAEDARRAP